MNKLFKCTTVTVLFFLLIVLAQAQVYTLTGTVTKESDGFTSVDFGPDDSGQNLSMYQDAQQWMSSHNEDATGVTSPTHPEQHMSIYADNLKSGVAMDDIIGKTYTFQTEDGFTEWNGKWWVKTLTPTGDAANVFQDGGSNDTLHTSVLEKTGGTTTI